MLLGAFAVLTFTLNKRSHGEIMRERVTYMKPWTTWSFCRFNFRSKQKSCERTEWYKWNLDRQGKRLINKKSTTLLCKIICWVNDGFHLVNWRLIKSFHLLRCNWKKNGIWGYVWKDSTKVYSKRYKKSKDEGKKLSSSLFLNLFSKGSQKHL